MRALLLLLLLSGTSPALAAVAHQQVQAAELRQPAARAFALDSIKLIQTAQRTGPIRGLVQVAVTYTNTAGEVETMLFNLPASNFTQAQLREIAAGAEVDQFVTLSVKKILQPMGTSPTPVEGFDLAVSAR